MFKNLKEARKNMDRKQFQAIQKKAEQAVRDLQHSEVNFIQILQEVEDHMVHRWFGFNSLYKYGVECLNLSSSQSYMYVHLAKATRKLKQLKKALEESVVTPSKAARILSVINEDNEAEWIQKAAFLPKNQLEKEVVKLNPKKAKGERSEYLSPDVIDMKTPVSEKVYKQLVRVQDLISQTDAKVVSMERVFEVLSSEYLKKNDPLEKAKRYEARQSQKKESPLPSENNPSTQREEELSHLAQDVFGNRLPLPNKILHQVHLRDKGECQYEYPSGEKCRGKRWVHLHHKVPISKGGDHNPKNILTLCSHHHNLIHLMMEENEKRGFTFDKHKENTLAVDFAWAET